MGNKIKRSILIVHEKKEMQDLFVHILGRDDFQLYTAANAAEAFDIIEQKPIELVFLDRRLPDKDGIEALHSIKKKNPLIKIVLLSGEIDRYSRSKALKMGAFGYLSKPFQIGSILKVTEQALDMTLIIRKVSPFADEDGEAIIEEAFSYRIPEHDRRVRIGVLLVSALTLGVIASGIAGFYYHRSDCAYQTPYTNPTAMTCDGSGIWVSDWVTQSYYRHEPLKEYAVSVVYYLQGSHPTGLAWDGKALWSCNAWEQHIYLHRMDSSFAVERRFKSPGPYPTALYYDGMYLWIGDSKSRRIYKTAVSSNGLDVLREYRSPRRAPVGIFSDGNNLWTADAETGCLYKHAFDDDLTVQGVYYFEQYDTGRDRLTGMTWDGKYIWTCSEGTRRMYRHHLKNLKERT